MGLAENLRTARLARGLTREQLAVAAGIASSTVARTEHGIFRPTVRTLDALADALGVTAAALIDDAPIAVERFDPTTEEAI